MRSQHPAKPHMRVPLAPLPVSAEGPELPSIDELVSITDDDIDDEELFNFVFDYLASDADVPTPALALPSYEDVLRMMNDGSGGGRLPPTPPAALLSHEDVLRMMTDGARRPPTPILALRVAARRPMRVRATIRRRDARALAVRCARAAAVLRHMR